LAPERWAIRRAFILDEFSFVVEDNGERKIMPLTPIIDALDNLKDVCTKKLSENTSIDFVG